MYPLHPKLSIIHRSAQASKRLEKIAAHYTDDAEVLAKLAAAKAALDAEVFALIKRAGLWGSLGKGVAIGSGVGAGLSVPAYLTGSALFEKGRDTARETAADIRNKVLQGALGVAAAGAGVYGLSNLLSKKTGGGSNDFANSLLGGVFGGAKNTPAPVSSPPQKLAADASAQKLEALEKLATVGAIEAMLDNLPGNIDEETRKHAAEVQVLNRSYGVHLLNELYTND